MDDRIYESLERAPPRCLADFGAVLTERMAKDHTRFAVFEMSCGKCQSGLFAVTVLSRVWKNGEEETDIGLIASCANCGNRAVLFDATRHGYDGENGHLGLLAGQDREMPLDESPSAARVRLEFIYNNDWEETLEMAEEQGKSPREYFDWMHMLRAAPTGGDWSCDWEYECA
jgi:hypothetical protein